MQQMFLSLFKERAETQIPGKACEYLKNGRPVVVIAPQGSATANLMEVYTASGIIGSENAVEVALFIKDAVKENMSDYFDRDISIHSRNVQSHKCFKLVAEYGNQ